VCKKSIKNFQAFVKKWKNFR